VKVFSVIGKSKSGKTTTIENIIKELKRRSYTVGSIKEIHYEKFTIDQEGTNTYRHRKAGSDLVTARGYYETDILFPRSLDINEILKFYSQDYVIMEGVVDYNCPIILCVNKKEDIEENRSKEYFERIFLISGVISNKTGECDGIPVINSKNNVKKLVDFIEHKVYKILPDFLPECCSECGFGCRELGVRILKGLAKVDDCILTKAKVKLFVNGRKIGMVPFVQNILKDCIKAFVKNLKGCEDVKKIELMVDDK